MAYDRDELWNYEVGSKNQFLDGRLTLNGALYYTDWSDIQTSIPLPCFFTFVANSGEAEIKGGELEMALIPFDGLTVTGAVSYVDAVLDAAAPGGDRSDGDPLPLTAKWSGNMTANYRVGLPNGLSASLRGEINYVGSRWNTFRSNLNAEEMDSYSTFNAGFRVESHDWSIGVFGTNLTDKHVVTFISPGASGHQVEARPRVIGVEGSYNF
jgi:outer membrane receptor protein involved in Fe transport